MIKSITYALKSLGHIFDVLDTETPLINENTARIMSDPQKRIVLFSFLNQLKKGDSCVLYFPDETVYINR